jgi:hypothetical protein
MKKILFLITISSIITFSCNDDFLEEYPQSQLSEDLFWQSEDDAFQGLVAVYARLGERGSAFDEWTTYLWGANTMTDVAMGGGWASSSFHRNDIFQNGSVNPASPTVLRYWKYLYGSIRVANNFLKNIERAEMDETVRRGYIAEVRFLRAFWYTILSDNWGGVPLVIEPLGIADLKIPRNSDDEVKAFIISELDNSAADLPATAADPGRITRGAANALKARFLLNNEMYPEAAVAAKAVMDSGTYNLFQDANGQGYFSVGQQANEDNSEVIFSIKFNMPDLGNYYQTAIMPPAHINQGWGAFMVSQAFVDAFECVDGMTIDQSPLFDPENPYKNRDPRLNMAVLKEGDMLAGSPLAGGTVNDAVNTGLYPNKAFNYLHTGWGLYDMDIVLLRYAEVLLTYAEAKIESGTIDQSVLDAINHVRARAYNTVFTDVDNYPNVTTLNQSELREIIRRERNVELANEHNDTRLQDIKRWRIAEDVLNGTMFGAKNDSGEYRVMQQLNFDSSKHYLWPIPQSEIDLIGSDIMTQNPGY